VQTKGNVPPVETISKRSGPVPACIEAEEHLRGFFLHAVGQALRKDAQVNRGTGSATGDQRRVRRALKGAGAGTVAAMCAIVLCNVIETGRHTDAHGAALKLLSDSIAELSSPFLLDSDKPAAYGGGALHVDNRITCSTRPVEMPSPAFSLPSGLCDG